MNTGHLPPPDQRFASIETMQDAHLALRRDLDSVEQANQRAAPDARREVLLLLRRIRDFERRAAATGTQLDDEASRDLAESLLNFWSLRQGSLHATVARLVRAAGQRPSGAFTLPAILPLAAFDEAAAPLLPDAASPFIGLNAFGEAEASRAIFQGRDDAVVKLTETVAAQRLVVVAGPSGSGKSSLVMAGLLPALKAGAIAGSDAWRYWPIVVPGNDPMAALLQAVRPADRDVADWWAQQAAPLRAAPVALPGLFALTPPAEQPSVLIADQTEEMFTQKIDPATQDAFVAALIATAQCPDPAHRAIIVLRSEYLDALRALPAFAALPDGSCAIFQPAPLTTTELTEAILKPASIAGLRFDPGIVDDLVRSVANDPAALPMLQFALTRLWQMRTRNRITRAAYDTIGEPRIALQRTADDVFQNLKTNENQVTARLIFQKLVTHSRETEFLRRRLRRETLHEIGDPGRIDRVLAAFVDAGLIRCTPGVGADNDQFDVMHEALLRNWPQLGEWLAETLKIAARRQQVLTLAQAWRDADRSPDKLAFGAALEEAAEFRDHEAIREYVLASRDAETARAKAQEETRARREREDKSRTWLWRSAFFLTAIALVAMLFSVYFSAQRQSADAAIQEDQALLANEIVNEERQASQDKADRNTQAIGPVVAAAVSTVAVERPGVDGALWVGTDRRPYVRDAQTAAITPPSTVRAGTLYRLRIDLALRKDWPLDGAYTSPPLLFPGSQAAAGALIEARDAKMYTRPSGQQYWLKVRLIPQVFVQFSLGSSESANAIVRDLRKRGYDVPPPEALPVKQGLREIRYYHAQDEQPALALARDLAASLGDGTTVAVASMRRAAKRAAPGTLEVWLDLPR